MVAFCQWMHFFSLEIFKIWKKKCFHWRNVELNENTEVIYLKKLKSHLPMDTLLFSEKKESASIDTRSHILTNILVCNCNLHDSFQRRKLPAESRLMERLPDCGQHHQEVLPVLPYGRLHRVQYVHQLFLVFVHFEHL